MAKDEDKGTISRPPLIRKETIAAIATPAGAGGICIVRMSGEAAHDIARKLCPGLGTDPSMRRAYHSRLVSPLDQSFIDEGLALLFAAPSSYTGEDVAEFHGHGGIAQSRAILEAVLSAGCRPARPGEFSLRAFENGRMDLGQAEGIAELVAARSEAALKAARAMMGGELSGRMLTLAEEVEGLLAQIEASIDFPDEAQEIDKYSWLSSLAVTKSRVMSLASTWKVGSRLREGPRAVLLGPPNSGKSSILNSLSGFDRALVDEEPGTTRDLIESRIELGGLGICLVDGAGIRAGGGGVEAAGIGRMLEEVKRADLVIGVFDGSKRPGYEEKRALEVIGDCRSEGACVILVSNKSDLGFRGAAELEGIEGSVWISMSAKTKDGLDQLLGAIGCALQDLSFGEGSLVVSLERHHLLLLEASESLEEAGRSFERDEPIDLVAEGLRDAVAALFEIVGRGAIADDLLGTIFSRFCIGK